MIPAINSHRGCCQGAEPSSCHSVASAPGPVRLSGPLSGAGRVCSRGGRRPGGCSQRLRAPGTHHVLQDPGPRRAEPSPAPSRPGWPAEVLLGRGRLELAAFAAGVTLGRCCLSLHLLRWKLVPTSRDAHCHCWSPPDDGTTGGEGSWAAAGGGGGSHGLAVSPGSSSPPAWVSPL